GPLNLAAGRARSRSPARFQTAGTRGPRAGMKKLRSLAGTELVKGCAGAGDQLPDLFSPEAPSPEGALDEASSAGRSTHSRIAMLAASPRRRPASFTTRV